jgi:hypothetical protein
LTANRFFNYKELSVEKTQEKSSGTWTSKYLAMHFEKVANLEEDLIRLPTPDEFFFLQTDKAFNAFTFIPLIAKRFPIKELHATTYSISRKVIDSLVELHDAGMVERITLLINDGMVQRNAITIQNLMAAASTRPNIEVLFAWVHAKVCLLRTHDFHYVIEGSGNWSENAHYEQYLLGNSKGLYDFRMKLITESKKKSY